MNKLLFRAAAVLLALLLLCGCAAPERGVVSGPAQTGAPDDMDPEAASVNLLHAKGGWYSSATGTYVADEIAFSDDWFFADPAEANPALALCSMQIEAACSNNSNGAAILRELGFYDLETRRYADYGINECACTVGVKVLHRDGTDYTLRAVFIQGSEYGETGWEQNVTVNGEDPFPSHAGYFPAVTQLLEELDPQGDPHVIWWVAGFSRGGGIANMTAAELAALGETVFACTFAAPAVTDLGELAKGPVYAGIHNYICDDDLVTMVPPWGMVRFGQDHSLSDFSPADVTSALRKYNTDAYVAVGKYYDGMWTVTYGADGSPNGGESIHDFLVRVCSGLEASVPTRADYSAPHTDSGTTEEGDVEVTWIPQDSMICLVRIFFSTADLPFSDMNDAAPLLRELIYTELETQLAAQTGDEAMAKDAVGRRWQTARSLCQAVGDDGVTPEGVYGLLVIVSPLLIRSASVLESGALPDLSNADPLPLLMTYMPEAMNLVSSANELAFSHHTDTLIVRLRLLCGE